MKIEQKDIDKIRGLIKKETGIDIDPRKDYFLKARIEKRILATGCDSVRAYIHILMFEKDVEFQELVEEVTINETYFFRDFPQLQGFAELALEDYCKDKRAKNDYNLKLWSAACSTGAEPYTLMIILSEMLDDFDQWNIEIVASDIDRKVLRTARMGTYNNRALKDVPPSYKEIYFSELGENRWKVIPSLKRNIVFEELNLVDRRVMRKKRGFDFIFCRNVLIYFDEKTVKQIVGNFYDSLKPDGYLFLGSSESVTRASSAYRIERKGGTIFYKK